MEILIWLFLVCIVVPICVVRYYKYRNRVQEELNEKARIHKLERERAEREAAQQKTLRDFQAKVEDFRNRKFPIDPADDLIKSKWNVWTSQCHDEEDQLMRQERALYNVTPLLIDTKACVGYFLSSDRSRIYETYLFTCSCADFENRDLPCKHIYRLFYDLNHPENIPNGIANIPDNVYESFLKASNSTKFHFVDQAIHLPNAGRIGNIDSAWRALIKSKLVIRSSPDLDSYTPLINSKTKDQIFDALKAHGIDDFRQSWTKERLINWIKTNHPDFLKKYFADYALLTLTPDAVSWAEGIKKSKGQYRVIPQGEKFWVRY